MNKLHVAWKTFEQRLIDVARSQGFVVLQIPTGCRVQARGGRPRLIPVKTPFDFVLGSRGVASFFDAKNCADTNFQYSQITPHQLNELMRLELEGFRAGYVVHFKKTGRVRFFAAQELARLLPGESLSESEGEDFGIYPDIDLNYLKRQ